MTEASSVSLWHFMTRHKYHKGNYEVRGGEWKNHSDYKVRGGERKDHSDYKVRRREGEEPQWNQVFRPQSGRRKALGEKSRHLKIVSRIGQAVSSKVSLWECACTGGCQNLQTWSRDKKSLCADTGNHVKPTPGTDTVRRRNSRICEQMRTYHRNKMHIQRV